jgi:aromatic amino acid aminotransferase I / 2-aminoadipate transaminase
MIAAAKWLKTPGLISLGGGLPSSEYFPFEELDIKVPHVPNSTSRNGHAQDHYLLQAGKHDMAEDKSMFDITTALQYGQGHGSAQFLRYLVEHTELIHDPPYQDWSCTMTIGSTSALDVTLRMFANPGDWMLSEEYTFVAAVETAAPLGVQTAAVPMDEYGMCADGLDDVLTNWDEKERGGPKPFLVYTVPTGQNPTGATQTAQRRRDIYAVAQKHDLIIMEDEPYYFLQMEPYTGPDSPAAAPPASHNDFVKALVPSYLSIDTDGRVIRMDSFSKVVAPGTRTGWITAPEQIVDRYRTHAELSTQGPSGISQLVLFKLLEDHWGHAGYLDWLIHLRMDYTARRNVMLAACEQYLPKDVVSWALPVAGIFYWLRLDHTKHPRYPQKSLEEIEEEIFHAIIQQKTLLMKGSWFRPAREKKLQGIFFRATYAAAPFDQIQEAIKRFGKAVRGAFELTDVSET